MLSKGTDASASQRTGKERKTAAFIIKRRLEGEIICIVAWLPSGI
jgi:hypothetical protein